MKCPLNVGKKLEVSFNFSSLSSSIFAIAAQVAQANDLNSNRLLESCISSNLHQPVESLYCTFFGWQMFVDLLREGVAVLHHSHELTLFDIQGAVAEGDGVSVVSELIDIAAGPRVTLFVSQTVGKANGRALFKNISIAAGVHLFDDIPTRPLSVPQHIRGKILKATNEFKMRVPIDATLLYEASQHMLHGFVNVDSLSDVGSIHTNQLQVEKYGLGTRPIVAGLHLGAIIVERVRQRRALAFAAYRFVGMTRVDDEIRVVVQDDGENVLFDAHVDNKQVLLGHFIFLRQSKL